MTMFESSTIGLKVRNGNHNGLFINELLGRQILKFAGHCGIPVSLRVIVSNMLSLENLPEYEGGNYTQRYFHLPGESKCHL